MGVPKSRTSAIVGGVIGGLGFVAIVGILVLFILRKRRNPKRDDSSIETDEPTGVSELYDTEPFMSYSSPTATSPSESSKFHSQMLPVRTPYNTPC